MACKIDLRDVIAAEASNQGVPPEIALAVAAQESGICHWAPNGNVLRGKAGEFGVFQLMPDTAVKLGVDPTDVNQNIAGGVKFLKQLYDRYGDWTLAVQRYNGSGPAAQAYAVKVMARARNYGYGLAVAAGSKSQNGGSPKLQAGVTSPVQKPSISRDTLVGIGIVAGAGLFAWAIAG
jgi:soluble lytic murein transglycosylase-like protein